MGTYLYIGICESAEVVGSFKGKTPQEIDDILGAEIDLNLFDRRENEHSIFLSMKEKHIKTELGDFLLSQYDMFNRDSEYVNSVIKKIKSAKNRFEILKILEEEYFLIDIQDYFRIKEWDIGVRIDYKLIEYFRDGKISMESGYSAFAYFENAIKLQRNTYPIAGAVKVLFGG